MSYFVEKNEDHDQSDWLVNFKPTGMSIVMVLYEGAGEDCEKVANEICAMLNGQLEY